MAGTLRTLALHDVVYDNNIGNADDSDPATALGGGSIVIHTGTSK